MSENDKKVSTQSGDNQDVRLKQPTDDNILRDLEAHVRDVPGNVADRIDRHPTYVSERIKQLEDYGLVENTGRSVYKLTDRGRAYLAGELDASDIED